jgi:hypothetical protein
VLRDDDKQPTEGVEHAFQAAGGKVIAWRDGRALEDELFLSLTDEALGKLIDHAIELHGENLINDHIKSVSGNARNLSAIQADAGRVGYSLGDRAILGRAARTRKAGWFKSVTAMEEAGRTIVGPDLAGADAGFRAIVESIFVWAANA